MVAVSGEEARKVFYTEPGLDMNQGYRILMGGAPRLEDINISNDGNEDEKFIKRLQLLTRKDRITEGKSLVVNQHHPPLIYCSFPHSA